MKTGGPVYKTRIIVSNRFVSPLVGRKSFNDSAINFKKAVLLSMDTPRLDANVSAKAANLGSSIGGTGKSTSPDTDNKKRSTDGAPPGLIELPGGYRYLPNATADDGMVLNLFPSAFSRESYSKEPNFGWVKKAKSVTIDEYEEYQKTAPRIRMRKYKVNSRTNDIILETEQELDPLYVNAHPSPTRVDAGDLPLEQKSLGDNLQKLVPGGSLLQRAVGRLGIIRDELNKLRCPPGTPAANQFTDALGSNCFGVSAGKIANYAMDMAQKFEKELTPFRNTAKNVSNFLFDVDQGRYGALFARTVWYDANGNKIKNIRKWRDIPQEGDGAWFVGGMARAQERLAQQDGNLKKIYDSLGVIRTPTMTKNEDVVQAFEELKRRGLWVGALNDRFSDVEVDRIINMRLRSISGFHGLSKERQDALRAADTKRWYDNERAILEALLEEHSLNPRHFALIESINYEMKVPGTDGYDEASAAPTVFGPNGLQSKINIDLTAIMRNQEQEIPGLKPDERTRIDVVGARTSAEAGAHLADFLTSVNVNAKQMAAMVEARAYARHIAKHEFAHTIQIAAFGEAIKARINANGFIEVTNAKGKVSQVSDITKLTSSNIFSIIQDVGDGIDMESLQNALSRLDVVAFLAGKYPREYYDEKGKTEVWAMEVTAELWSLRDLGLIYGDDIDAALEYMDSIMDRRHASARILSDYDAIEADSARYFNIPEEGTGGIEDLAAREAAEARRELKELKNTYSTMSESQLIEEISLEKARVDALRISGADETSPELERHQNRLRAAESAWRKKYGVGGAGDKKNLNRKVDQHRTDRGLHSPERLAEDSRKARMREVRLASEAMDVGEITQKLADYEVKLRDASLPADERSALLEEVKLFKTAYKARLEEGGDSRTWAQQRRELEKNIDLILRPERPLRKVHRIATDVGAQRYSNEQRAKLLQKATPQQRHAIVELGDASQSAIGLLLDPEFQQDAIDAINRRHRRLQKMGLVSGAESENVSRHEGSLEKQIEHILIPAMELIDESRIPDNLEVEAVLHLDIDPATGETITTGNIEHSGLLTARLITKKSPADGGSKLDESGSDITRLGKRRQRVVIQVAEGDRGIFQHWTFDAKFKDENQNLTLPPGKLKIIEVKPDGTIIAQIEEQKNAAEVMDDLVKDTSRIMDPESVGAGGSKRLQRLADDYAVMRRKNGLSTPSKDDNTTAAIADRNVTATRAIIESGGKFGEPVSQDYIDEPRIIDGVIYIDMSPSGAKKLSSRRSALGEPDTREGRTTSRKKRQSAIVDTLRGEINGTGTDDSTDEDLWLRTADDTRGPIQIDPRVEIILRSKTVEEITKATEDAAVDMHEGFDRRPRVRMTEDELNTFADVGFVKHHEVEADFGSDSSRRLARRNAQNEAGSATPGISTPDELDRKTRGLRAWARRVTDAEAKRREKDNLRRIIAPTDDPTLRPGVRPHMGPDGKTQAKTWNDKNVWETDSADDALSLIAAGEHVYITSWDEQAKLLNGIAEQFKAFESLGVGVGWDINEDGVIDSNDLPILNACLFMAVVDGKTNNMFCDTHLDIARLKMPQVGGTVLNNEATSIRAWKAGLLDDTGGTHDSFVGRKNIEKSTFNPKTELFKELSETFADAIAKKKDEFAKDKKPFTDVDAAKVIYGKLAGQFAKKKISDEHKAIFFENTDFTRVEVNVTTEFIKMIGEKGVVTGDAVGANVRDLHATQNELQLNKMGGIAKTMTEQFAEYWKEIEAIKKESLTDVERDARIDAAKKKWLSHFINAPIIVSADGAIFDGHHRAYGRYIFETRLTKEQLEHLNDGMEFQVRRSEASVSVLLELGKAFQDEMGIAPATLNPGTVKWTDNSLRVNEMTDTQWADLIGGIGSKVNEHIAKQVPSTFFTKNRLEETGKTSPAILKGRGTWSDRVYVSARTPGGAYEKLSSGATRMTVQEKRTIDAKTKLGNLEKAREHYEKTGDWIGGDLGVDISLNDNSYYDSIDPEGFSGRNQTAVEFRDVLKQNLEKRGVTDPAEIKEKIESGIRERKKDLDRKIEVAKRDVELQEYVETRKRMRIEQNVIDVEDITPDELDVLRKENTALAELRDSTSQSVRADYYSQFRDEKNGVEYATHVGSSELEDGFSDPNRSVGTIDNRRPEYGARGSGDTRALNNRAVELMGKEATEGENRAKLLIEKIKELKETGNVTARDRQDVDILQSLGFPRIIDEPGGVFHSTDDNRERIILSMESRLKDIEDRAKRARTLSDSASAVSGGFVSASSASDPIDTRGYFGRYAASAIPKDISENPGEYERATGKLSKIHDEYMHTKWMGSLRGTAWLFGGKQGEDITNLLGPSDEKQVVGKQKPLFGISARVHDAKSEKIIDETGLALMARAIKLRKEGKTPTVEAILGRDKDATRGLAGGKLSSGATKPSNAIGQIRTSGGSGAGRATSPRAQGRSSIALSEAGRMPDTASKKNTKSLEGQTAPTRSEGMVGTGASDKRRLSSGAYKSEYEHRIGIHESTPSDSRPVNGYLVHKSHIEEKKRRVLASGSGNTGPDAIFELQDKDIVGDGLTSLGEIEVVLKSGVSNRTAYGSGESVQTAHRPVMMNSRNREDITDALTNFDGTNGREKSMDAMINLLGGSIDNNYSSAGARLDGDRRMRPVGKPDPSADTRDYDMFEASILGGFNKDEVEGIHYPYSKIQGLAENENIDDVMSEATITAKLSKLGFTPEEILQYGAISVGKPLDNAGSQKLREYRAAKRIKSRYEKMGIGYVKFAHPQGLNIENPRTYSKKATGRENVEDILKEQIFADFDESAKKFLKEMRKSPSNNLIGRPL